MNHPTEGEVYVLERLKNKERLLAFACDDGNWQSMGSDYADINDWGSSNHGDPPTNYKVIAHVDINELKFTEVSLD